MITMRMVGWLANQMFQYAMGRYISIKNKDKELYLDLDPFYYDIREYELDIFNVKTHIATKRQRPWYLILFKNKIIDKVWYMIAFICKKLDPRYIIENPRHPIIYRWMYDFQPRILNLKKK